jgi:hypothetical protein
MRILTLGAAAAGLTLAGGALIGPAQAQVYYVPQAAPTYVAPAPGYAAPAPSYYSYYDADGNLVTGVAASPLGTVLAPAYGPAMRYDQYGPDPNGMIAADGHRIKCKIDRDWDSYRDRYVARRVCD